MLTVYIVVNVILVNKEYYSEYYIFTYIYHLQICKFVDVKLNLRPIGRKQERVYIYG